MRGLQCRILFFYKNFNRKESGLHGSILQLHYRVLALSGVLACFSSPVSKLSNCTCLSLSVPLGTLVFLVYHSSPWTRQTCNYNQSWGVHTLCISASTAEKPQQRLAGTYVGIPTQINHPPRPQMCLKSQEIQLSRREGSCWPFLL